jgi:hypothetical protein
MLLYKKIKIPNFDVMSEEILKMVQPQISQNLRYWDLPFTAFQRHTPELFKYLTTNFHRLPILFRFYNTPPYSDLPVHTDNIETAKNKIALNMPLYGTKNTTMDYYVTDKDNLHVSYTDGIKDYPIRLLKDNLYITLIDSMELDSPSLIRTDILHGVRNNNDYYRLTLSLKFVGDNFDTIFKILPENASQ